MRRSFADKKFEIVGMVGDVKLTRLGDNRPDRIYFPHVHVGGDGSMIVRTRVAPLLLAEPIRKAILEVDGDQPVSNVRTLEQDITRSVAARRQTLTLLGLFAVVALGLAALGLYGILAHAVALRRHDIGSAAKRCPAVDSPEWHGTNPNSSLTGLLNG